MAAKKKLTKKRMKEITAVVESCKSIFMSSDAVIDVTFNPEDGNKATTAYKSTFSHDGEFTINFDPEYLIEASETDTLETVMHEFVHLVSYQLNCEIDALRSKLAPDHHERVIAGLEAQTNKLARILRILVSGMGR